MIRYESIHHISLIVRDLDRAKEFYRDVLMLTEIYRPPFSSSGVWFEVGITGQQVHLIANEGEGAVKAGEGHFALRVTNYGQAIRWLKSHGVEHTAKPDSVAGFAQIYFKDPDGNEIELNAIAGI